MKKAVAVFLSILLIFSLSACSSIDEAVNTNTNTPPLVSSKADETEKENIEEEPKTEPQKESEADTAEKQEPATEESIALKKEYYYQYSFLSKNEKALYNRFVSAVENFENTINIAEFKLSEDTVKKVHSAFMADNPQYFYLAKSCSYVINSENKFITEFVFCYFDGTTTDTFDINDNAITLANRDLIKSQIADFNKKISAILSVIPAEHSPLQKEKMIYEYILDTVTYDKKTASIYQNNGSAFSDSFTSFGALLKGNAVCEGYVKLFQWLCYNVGINVTPVESGSNMSHMWAAVNLEGSWYMADPTWDDADNQLVCLYKYFNVTKKFLSLDHSFNTSSKLKIPECTNDKASFFNNYALKVENGKFLKNYKDIIDLTIKNSAKYIYIYRGTSSNDYKELIDKEIYSGEISKYLLGKNITLAKEYYHTDNYYFIPIEAKDNF